MTYVVQLVQPSGMSSWGEGLSVDDARKFAWMHLFEDFGHESSPVRERVCRSARDGKLVPIEVNAGTAIVKPE